MLLNKLAAVFAQRKATSSPIYESVSAARQYRSTEEGQRQHKGEGDVPRKRERSVDECRRLSKSIDLDTDSMHSADDSVPDADTMSRVDSGHETLVDDDSPTPTQANTPGVGGVDLNTTLPTEPHIYEEVRNRASRAPPPKLPHISGVLQNKQQVFPPLNFTSDWDADFGSDDVQDFHETNPVETRYGPLKEGDVLFDPEQERKGVPGKNLWKNRQYHYRIPDESMRGAAEAGINFWRDNTCITFTEVLQDSSKHHVEFIDGDGCWSYVGVSANRGSQPLSLGRGCRGLGTVTHEIGHSLGFFHEQSRTDRDGYVTILRENIKAGSAHNFNKNKATKQYGVPYDFGSVMHYGSKFFSSNGKYTIRTNDPTKQPLIGQRVGPSFRDIAQMNRMYQCEKLCARPPPCKNGGYISADCKCHCPPNTSGAGCHRVTGSYYPKPACGGRITSPGTISSPSWPNVYPPGSQCIWWITPPAGRKARVTFGEFQILRRVRGECYEFMQVSGRGLMGDGEKSCETELTGQTVTSNASDGSMLLNFRAYHKYYGGKGFTATIKFL